MAACKFCGSQATHLYTRNDEKEIPVCRTHLRTIVHETDPNVLVLSSIRLMDDAEREAVSQTITNDLEKAAADRVAVKAAEKAEADKAREVEAGK